MIREYIIKYDDDEKKKDIHGGYPLIEPRIELIRCKDCVHRGNEKKCIVAYVAREQDFPVFSFDNRGYWFCADGKSKD